MEKDKILIKNLKEFRTFYNKALRQCKKDKKGDAHLTVINQKIKEIDELIEKYK